MLPRVSYLVERNLQVRVAIVVDTHKSSGESHTWLSETLRINFRDSSSESHIWLSETFRAELEVSIDSHGLMRSERANEPGDDGRAQSKIDCVGERDCRHVTALVIRTIFAKANFNVLGNNCARVIFVGL